MRKTLGKNYGPLKLIVSILSFSSISSAILFSKFSSINIVKIQNRIKNKRYTSAMYMSTKSPATTFPRSLEKQKKKNIQTFRIFMRRETRPPNSFNFNLLSSIQPTDNIGQVLRFRDQFLLSLTC